jgi:hypothetical protein
LGAALLDLDDPTRVIHRPKESILWLEELWELRGDVPNVVFCCANPVVDGTVYVYYGGGDHVIGLAICRLALKLPGWPMRRGVFNTHGLKQTRCISVLGQMSLRAERSNLLPRIWGLLRRKKRSSQ